MVLDKSVVSQLAIIFLVARFLLLFMLLASLLLVFNSVAGRDAGTDLVGLLVLLLAAFASGFLEFLQLRLAVGAQRGQAGLFSVAVGLEASLLLGIGRLGAVQQGAFAIANSLLLGATVQGFVVSLVVPAVGSAFVATILLVMGILLRESEARDGLLDTVFEIGFQGLSESLSAFTTSSAVAFFAAGGSAATAFTTFTFFGFGRRSASVVGVAGVEFRFQGFEFGLSGSFVLFVSVLDAFMEGVEFGGAVLSQSRSKNASSEQSNSDSLHDFSRIGQEGV